MEAIQKCVNVRFFYEKSETLKKCFFQKVPKTTISYLHVICFQMETKIVQQ